MKFSEFINDVKSKGGVDTDRYYGKQCMDLYNYYCNNFLNLQNVGASCAKEILNNSNLMNNVKRIDNYLEFVPQKGDIAVWTGNQYGHVAICLGEGDINSFKTIDQNWKGTRQLTEEWHNYTYMAPLVFLRPKNQTNIQDKSIDELADEVIALKWGVGQDRKNRLTQAGYDYNAIQQRVNEKLSADTKSIDQLAQEVIAGKWGVGQDRKNRLTQAGYDYNAVQNRVNQILK